MPNTDSPELAPILDAIRREPSPTRRMAQRRVNTMVSIAIVGALLCFFLVGGVRRGPRPLSLVMLTALGSFAVSALAVWGAFSRGHSMLGRSRTILFGIIAATPVALYGWTLFC